MNSTDGSPRRSLAAKIGAIGCALLALAMIAIGMTLWLTWQLEGGAAAVNEAGRMRMQTWRLAQTLTPPQLPPPSVAVAPSSLTSTIDANASKTNVLPAWQQHLKAMDESLALLATGDPGRPLALPGDPASLSAFARVRQDWAALRGRWQSRAQAVISADGSAALDKPPAHSAVADEAAEFVAAIDDLVDATERQLARWTTRLNIAQFLMMALALGAAFTLLAAAQLLVFRPLGQLRDGLAAVEAGDLSVRVQQTSDDEFGKVAAGFNRMAQRLQSLYGSLEQQVAHKTLHIEAQRSRLAALYDAAAFVTRVRSLDVLARGFATRAREAVRADAVAVRWSDEQNRRYILLASEGLPPDMVEAEHCVATGDCFCGQPQASAVVRIFPLRRGESEMPDRPQQYVDPGQCRRAGFVSLTSVPVRLHERLVGEIDLFFRKETRLTTEDQALLEAMASHLAGAIEGLRAEALQREAAVAEERGLLARELHDSIAQSLAFLKIQSNLLRDEIDHKRTDRVSRTLGELDEGIRESLSDVRELLVHFRTRTNTEDIAPALRTTLTKFEHQTGLATELTIGGHGMALAPDVQIHVLHVVLEALSNVRKHARASSVHVHVEQSPHWIVSVADDGCGFDASTWRLDETHVGLKIMGERAAGIGATLDVSAAPGRGTTVTLTLPKTTSGQRSPGSRDDLGALDVPARSGLSARSDAPARQYKPGRQPGKRPDTKPEDTAGEPANRMNT